METQLGFAHFIANADGMASFILAVLLLMSVGTWYLIAVKGIALLRARSGARRFLRVFREAGSLESLATRLRAHGVGDAFSHLVHHGFTAIEQHHAGRGARGLIEVGTPEELLTRALKRAIAQDRGRLEYGQTFIATVASSAPFVGLFGTVWGIYHALMAIGASGQGTLDKVAGPVGEALIMTALGLAVALPAAIAYNAFARAARNTLAELNSFAHDVYVFLVTGMNSSPRGGEVVATSERIIARAVARTGA